MKVLKRYHFYKFIALLMAFVWLFGIYAADRGGVHATNPVELDPVDITSNEETLEFLEPASLARMSGSDWNLYNLLRRRDYGGTDGGLSDGERWPINFPSNLGPPITPSMNFGAIHNAFFICETTRRAHENSSGHFDQVGIRFPECPAQRLVAFRLWHIGEGLRFLEMTPGSDDTLENHGRNWGVGSFQYAYVQRLYFNTNFDGRGTPDDHLGPTYTRSVIIGSHYDRMFVSCNLPSYAVGINTPYETLRNYTFPASPGCPFTPLVPGTQPGPRNLVHPEGYIFGGWFNSVSDANNHGTSEGQLFDERAESVTPYAKRTLFARWYEPKILKTVYPESLTPEQVAAGATVTYTITINTDKMPASRINFNVVDVLDERLTFLPGSVVFPDSSMLDAPTYTFEDGILTFDIRGSTSINHIFTIIEEIEITFKATVNPNATGKVENTVSLYGPPGTGPNGGNDPVFRSLPAELEILSDPTGSITVNVVDGDDNPVPGALVNLYDGQGNPIGTGIAGVNGQVVFPDLPDGEYTVIVTHPDHLGWRFLEEGITIVNASDAMVTAVIPGPVLAGTGSITVNIVDRESHPAPGASVSLYDDQGRRIGSGIAGTNGQVVFPNLPDGEYTLIITHPDHPGWRQVQEVEIVNANDVLVRAVIPGPVLSEYTGSITVNVVDRDSNPVPRAHVNLYDREGNRIGSGVTGVNGRVIFLNLPDGEYTVIVTHPDHSGWRFLQGVTIVNASDAIVTAVIPGPVIVPEDPTLSERNNNKAAPRTGDSSSTVPFLAASLFSMSAILGGTSLKKRLKR